MLNLLKVKQHLIYLSIFVPQCVCWDVFNTKRFFQAEKLCYVEKLLSLRGCFRFLLLNTFICMCHVCYTYNNTTVTSLSHSKKL